MEILVNDRSEYGRLKSCFPNILKQESPGEGGSRGSVSSLGGAGREGRGGGGGWGERRGREAGGGTGRETGEGRGEEGEEEEGEEFEGTFIPETLKQRGWRRPLFQDVRETGFQPVRVRLSCMFKILLTKTPKRTPRISRSIEKLEKLLQTISPGKDLHRTSRTDG